ALRVSVRARAREGAVEAPDALLAERVARALFVLDRQGARLHHDAALAGELVCHVVQCLRARQRGDQHFGDLGDRRCRSAGQAAGLLQLFTLARYDVEAVDAETTL